MKTITFIFILYLFGVFADDCSGPSHHAIFGTASSTDELLYEWHPKTASKFLRKVVQDIDYPGPSDIKGKITHIEILDQYTDGNGGCASIVNGGVGSNHVLIHLKSQRNEGLDFIVKIYGKRIQNY